MNKQKLYYFSSDMGCGIRAGLNDEKVEAEVINEVGSAHGVKDFREATAHDLSWVKSMGGYIPKV